MECHNHARMPLALNTDNGNKMVDVETGYSVTIGWEPATYGFSLALVRLLTNPIAIVAKSGTASP